MVMGSSVEIVPELTPLNEIQLESAPLKLADQVHPVADGWTVTNPLPTGGASIALGGVTGVITHARTGVIALKPKIMKGILTHRGRHFTR